MHTRWYWRDSNIQNNERLLVLRYNNEINLDLWITAAELWQLNPTAVSHNSCHTAVVVS